MTPQSPQLSPDEHDIEFYTTCIQLASAQGKVHRPGAGELEECVQCQWQTP